MPELNKLQIRLRDGKSYDKSGEIKTAPNIELTPKKIIQGLYFLLTYQNFEIVKNDENN